jgi:DNA polymerase-1
MAGRYVFDCETDGLLPDLTKLHCLGIKCLDTGKVWSLADQPGYTPIREGLALLADADLIVGHNIIGFDIPAIQKVYPGWKTRALVRDTLVLTRLMWPHIKDGDFALAEKGTLPKRLIGQHKLEAWGYRLGILKDEYKGGWDAWSETMQSYMDQDVRVTAALWARIEKEAAEWGVPLEDPNPPPRKDCIELEHRVAAIVEQVQKHGIRFNKAKAAALFAKITARLAEVENELAKAFPPKVVESVFVPKANNKKLGYVKGVPFTKRKVVPFNPGSRQQVAERLQGLGWKPQSYGKDGIPTVDDDILTSLPYPEAKLLAEYFMLDKRLGQIANGKEAWLKHERNGRIHGRIHSGGAHTGRMTHSNPNLAQVPKASDEVPYGAECRECFEADEGYVLVGCDADALELRDLAGYMAAYDGGAYIETVLKGDKAKGTDMHTINAKAIGCSRDMAKIFFYAMIYGSGFFNLGAILGVKGSKAKVTEAGKAAKARLMAAVPALGKLIAAVEKKIGKDGKGYLTGLDGRRLRARSANAALNTLLQSAGAVQMKRGLVILYDTLLAKGWEFGREFAIVLLVHDEWQTNVLPHLADEYGEAACEAIRAAGRFYSFRCPLEAQYDKGENWRDTH